ncbi:hypothetical protein [Aliiruegeria haliotis]|nr:hypothetical protein [Aliiruegeria haliotis]
MSGGPIAMYRDLWMSGMIVGVADAVSTELVPGKSCLVASIDEVWTTPLDMQMKELGRTQYRKRRFDVEDDQILSAVDKAKESFQKRNLGLTTDDNGRKARLQKVSSLAAEALL